MHGSSSFPLEWNKLGYDFTTTRYSLVKKGEDFLLTNSLTEEKWYQSETRKYLLIMRTWEHAELGMTSFEEPHFPLLVDWENYK